MIMPSMIFETRGGGGGGFWIPSLSTTMLPFLFPNPPDPVKARAGDDTRVHTLPSVPA